MLLLFALNTLAKSHQSKYQKHNDKSPELGFGRIFLLRLSEFNREKKKKRQIPCRTDFKILSILLWGNEWKSPSRWSRNRHLLKSHEVDRNVWGITVALLFYHQYWLISQWATRQLKECTGIGSESVYHVIIRLPWGRANQDKAYLLYLLLTGLKVNTSMVKKVSISTQEIKKGLNETSKWPSQQQSLFSSLLTMLLLLKSHSPDFFILFFTCL